MKEPTYRDALRASWRLAWRHKNLWPFGLFAMLLGQFGLAELFTKIWSSFFVAKNTSLWAACKFLITPEAWNELKVLLTGDIAQAIWIVWLALLLFGIGFGLLFVASLTQGALVYAAVKFSKFRLNYPDLGHAWNAGARHVWKIIMLNIFRKIVLWLAVGWAGIASWQLATAPTGLSQFIFWIAFLTALAVGAVSSILLLYAVGYVVMEEYKIWASIRSAWHLFLDHPLVSIETAVITLFLNIGLFLFAMFSVLYVFFLPNIIAKYAVVLFNAPLIGKITGVVSYSLFLGVLLFASAVFTVFVTSVWSFLFSKMHSGNFVSRIVRSIRR